MACLEHECVIFDRHAMHAALVTVGWVPTERIVKQRRTGDWDGATVCADVVDGLGAFVEVERVVNSQHSGEQVQHGLDAMKTEPGPQVGPLQAAPVEPNETVIATQERAER
ncbi:CYTH domain-containing protein [Micromonospora sp. STR1_7]|uniref:CYTH domain-containing protein n=1 Tax=Micromonospora parastrephiae TaxID=2806101 RepID=A0ABS1XN33_9ACTN|nr:CYTH domain-containing protein [Micromonospora parastrephiae]